MYLALLALHSFVRWLALALLAYSAFRSFFGYYQNRTFSKLDNIFRHWTATVAHLQLMIGIVLYTQSPVVKYFWSEAENGLQNLELTFYGLVHMGLMLTAIVVLTIGSALAKRRPTDREKFKTMFVWFSMALFIIIIAIPWPFSPFSNRPNFRMFNL